MVGSVVAYGGRWEYSIAKKPWMGSWASVPNDFHSRGDDACRRIAAVGGFTATELDQIGHAHPNPINCGSLLMLRR